jgi:hypothetical protein
LRSPAAEPLVVSIVGGLVGGKGTFTPTRAEDAVPAGRYDVTFEADV